MAIVSTSPAKTEIDRVGLKEDPTVCFLQEPQFKHKDLDRLTVKGDTPCYYLSEESWISYAHFRRADFRTRKTIREEEGRYVTVRKESVLQEERAVSNTRPPGHGAGDPQAPPWLGSPTFLQPPHTS